jgi:hypothetical protein
MRAFRLPRLLDVRCILPELGEEASSVNEAYTRLSRAYERGRRSSTGNVFLVVYGPSSHQRGAATFVPLGELRQLKHEEYIDGMIQRLRSSVSEEDVPSAL